MRTWTLALLVALGLGSSGCAFAPLEETTLEDLPTVAGSGKVLFVGPLYDYRTVVLGTPVDPLGPESGENPVAFVPVLANDVRTPAGEVRSVLAQVLQRSGLFSSVLAPPLLFVGESRSDMIARAQEASDYLLVGEITQFNVRNLGTNAWGIVTLPLDMLAAPATMVAFMLMMGKAGLFTGGLVSAFSAEVILSITVSVVDVDSGIVVATVRTEQHALDSYGVAEAYGDIWDEEDDWLDMGRRLGEIAMHNAAVDIARQLPRLLPELLTAPGGGP